MYALPDLLLRNVPTNKLQVCGYVNNKLISVYVCVCVCMYALPDLLLRPHQCIRESVCMSALPDLLLRNVPTNKLQVCGYVIERLTCVTYYSMTHYIQKHHVARLSPHCVCMYMCVYTCMCMTTP